MHKKIKRRAMTIIQEIEVFIMHVAGYIPSHHFRRLIYRLGGVKIGKGSSLHMGIRFYNPHNIKIGKDTIIGEGTVLDGRAKLIIGDHVDIATEVMIYNSEHDVNEEDFANPEKIELGEVEINDYVFIGPRAIILPGVKIGKGAVVGAGAVVTKDIAEFAIAGGVPAQIIGERKNKDLHYKLGRAAWFR
jgi:acetyltransferase-like isoleucine patch superfamily enzyme